LQTRARGGFLLSGALFARVQQPTAGSISLDPDQAPGRGIFPRRFVPSMGGSQPYARRVRLASGGPFPSPLPGAQGGNSQVFGVISRDKSRRSGKRDVVSPGRFPSNDDAARLLSHHLHDGGASLSLDLGDQASQQAYGHQALEWRLSIEGFCSGCRKAGVAGISGRTRKRGKEKALDLCHQRAEPRRASRRPLECQS